MNEPTLNDTAVEVPMDACDLLDADHLAVKHLFVECARLAYAQPDSDRSALVAKICDELTVHAQIEEEIFYPELRQAVPDSAAQLEDATQEHQEAKDMIAQIRAAPPGPQQDALVARLAGAIEHHVKDERTKIFPKARAAPELDLMEMAARLKARQGELMGAGEGAPAA
jgi:hemerythrin superfamily protein